MMPGPCPASRLPPDPVFVSLNASIGFDWRLAPYDVEQSRAHATMLAAAGIITDSDRDELLGGLDRVAAELDAGEFPFLDSDEDIHMAVERRLTEIVGAVGGKLHTARSRNDQVATDMAMFTRAHALRAIEALQDLQTVIVRVAEAHLDWAMPGYTHLQRAQPVYLSHHLLAYFWMFRRDAARFEVVLGVDGGAAAGRRRAGGRELPDRPPAGGLASSGSRAWCRTRSTPSPTATSCSTSWPPRPPARRICRGWARRSCCGPRRSSASARSRDDWASSLVDHAAEEEPGRGRAAAREGAADRRPSRRRCTA